MASIFIIIGVAAVALGTFAYTVVEHFYDEDAFVEVFDNLSAEESLRERVADGATDQLMAVSRVAVGDRIYEFGSLSDLGILGDIDESDVEAYTEAIEGEQQSIIRSVAGTVVNDANFPETFERAVRRSHSSLLDAFADETEVINEGVGEVYVNISAIYDPIQRGVADQVVTQPVSEVDVPSSTGRLKVLDKTAGFDWLWDGLRLANDWSQNLMIIAVAGLVLAFLVSDRRPWVLVTFGAGVAFIAVLVIVVLYVVWALIPLMTTSGSSSLVGTVYRAAIAPLVRNEILVAAAGIGLTILGYIARWVWPDDWVYEHHDAGAGPMAVRTMQPTQQAFPQQAYYPQNQPMPQPQLRPAIPAGTPEPFASQPAALPAPPPEAAEPEAAPTNVAPPAGPVDPDAADWDYEAGEW